MGPGPFSLDFLHWSLFLSTLIAPRDLCPTRVSGRLLFPLKLDLLSWRTSRVGGWICIFCSRFECFLSRIDFFCCSCHCGCGVSWLYLVKVGQDSYLGRDAVIKLEKSDTVNGGPIWSGHNDVWLWLDRRDRVRLKIGDKTVVVHFLK